MEIAHITVIWGHSVVVGLATIFAISASHY